MLGRRHIGLAGLIVLVLLLGSASAAFAQTGGGDQYVLGSNYSLAAGERLNGSLYVAGGNATLARNSTVNGNVSVAGGSAAIAGHVTGDVNVIGGSVILESTAVVDGNLNRIGGSISEAPGAVVRGVRQNGAVPRLNPPGGVVPQRSTTTRLVESPFNGFLQVILRFFGALGMGLLLALIAVIVLLVVPGPAGQVATTAAREPALSFAAGLLTLILASLIGFPLLIACGLGLLVWLTALIALIFGWIAVGLWLGQRLFALIKVRTASSLAEGVVGVFLITWLAWVSPRCIGFLFGLAVGAIGMGAVLLTRFGTQSSGGLSGPGGLPSSGRPEVYGNLDARSAPQESTQAAGRDAGIDSQGRVPPEPTGATAQGPATGPIQTEADAGAMLGQSTPPDEPPAGPSEDLTQMRGLAEGTASAPETPNEAPRGSGTLEDLEAVQGITPEIAARLRGAGSTTLIAVASSDVSTLANQAGVSSDQVEQQDWIGQARRLLG